MLVTGPVVTMALVDLAPPQAKLQAPHCEM